MYINGVESNVALDGSAWAKSRASSVTAQLFLITMVAIGQLDVFLSLGAATLFSAPSWEIIKKKPRGVNDVARFCLIKLLLVLEPSAADATGDQRNQEEHDKHQEQQLRDTRSGAGNSSEPQRGRDQSHYQKYQRVMQHVIAP
jgi:hypothetical protein